MDDIDVPRWWKRSAEKILKNRWRKILVVGATDCGKSAYCGFLCRTLCAAGFPVAFVDADVGQKDVGPPATISLALLEGEVEFSNIQSEKLYFVGGTSPRGRMLPMIVGTRKLVDAADAPFLVIDTTGLVHGPGRVLKAFQIDSIQPDAIVCIERHEELEPLVRSFRTHNIIRIRASRRAVSKSGQARIAARKRLFKAYFERAKTISLNFSDIVFQRFPILGGIPIDVDGCEYAEKYPDGIIGVSGITTEEISRSGIAVLPSGFERNLLCGVLDSHSEMMGLAILEEIDFRSETASLFTPVPSGKIAIVQSGDLYLDREGRELGKARYLPKNF